MEGSLQMCGDSLQPQLSGKAQTELQASFVECQLALAQVKLQNEQVCRHASASHCLCSADCTASELYATSIIIRF